MLRRVNDEYLLTALYPNQGCKNYYIRNVSHRTPTVVKPINSSQNREYLEEFWQILNEFNKTFLQQNPVIYSTDC